MTCVLLALTAPLQSWGTDSRFIVRYSGTEPSKSGVVGLCAAALGRQRDEPIRDLASLRMGVRVDAQGVIQCDYHTAMRVIRADGSLKTNQSKDTVISWRYFLADAAFLVALEGDEELVKSIDNALRHPCRTLFLGRKAFTPTGPLAIGIDHRPLEDALAAGPWTDPSPMRTKQLRKQLESGKENRLRTVIEVPVSAASEFRNDQPVSFSPRVFTRRPTKTGYILLNNDILGNNDMSEDSR